ncbi:glycine C-acetyltransferase [bacterium]|nr:glycine C-acetyltransferase [bacterium]
MSKLLRDFLVKEINNLEAAGLLQEGLSLNSPQGPNIKIGSKNLLNFASDNYLGWANHPSLKEAAKLALDELGTGWASGRLFSGTHATHRKLEEGLSQFLRTQETLLFSSGYQANLGIFESLFNEQDYIFCDFSLHPSMVDGIRLSAAKHFIFKTQDLNDLEDKLKRSPNARFRAIATEAVSSQDGRITPLADIVAIAKRYDAIVIVDDSHGVGVLGNSGRGISEELDLLGKVDLITGSLGHALGGASGGFVSGRREIISWLRQKARSYLFSNSPTPAISAAALKAIELLDKGSEDLENLRDNTERFRKGLADAGFDVVPSTHPIVSIVVGDALLAQKMTNRLYQKGILVLGFCYPVMPRGSARVRVQISAAHLKKDLTEGITAFKEVGQGLKLI